jgi:hypothetical protein
MLLRIQEQTKPFDNYAYHGILLYIYRLRQHCCFREEHCWVLLSMCFARKSQYPARRATSPSIFTSVSPGHHITNPRVVQQGTTRGNCQGRNVTESRVAQQRIKTAQHDSEAFSSE